MIYVALYVIKSNVYDSVSLPGILPTLSTIGGVYTNCGLNPLPATQRVIQDGKTGFLVKDKKEFLDKITYILENKDKMAEIQDITTGRLV